MKSFCVLILVSALLAGCSGSDEKPAVVKPSEPAPPGAPVANAPAPADPGQAFLADNAKKDGVKTTASGLQYLVLKSGTGETPKATDRVKVHYHGTLIDGTVFDSSVQRGEPASFGVTQVIPGWVEALQMMKVGDKWKLFIPARLAYGDQSPSPAIPPNSPLIFEVELLAIEK